MGKTLKKVIIAFLLLAIIGVVGFFAARYYAYHGGKRDVQSEEAAFTLKAKDFVAEFTANEASANKKYLEKPVAVSGAITSVNGKEVILDDVVVCNFTTPDATLKVGQTISIKGRAVGFDDLMGSVNLDQCSINN
ncbi:OB-fold protein [Flavobacterium aciduliphilum]|uniref:Putative nucleic acid binding protein n=1 Tax=Flavobacterium aciduliphilum TaxID=1101402 RepID=A0A328YS96_9FLAO|nr:hypothetical protein [Flavobacterium aciduliphilum]RAR75635.1 putative nucleic acid binding protein [Flavobacterium aciduliphilum]